MPSGAHIVRIYVSSTYSDLVDARSTVYKALRSLRHDVIAMEDYVATDQRPLDKCLADVATSDVYVGIFAWRYGYVPPSQEQSITELEFRKAVETSKPCLLFLLHEEASWPRKLIDRDSRLEAFRAELERDYVISFFRSIDELASLVSIAVTNHLEQRMPIEGQTPFSVNYIVSEAAAMTFVDLMRLLYVASSDLAFKHNIDRYDEFVRMATDHSEDLRSQLDRFSPSVSSDSVEGSKRIERQVSWGLRRLRSRPTRPRVDEQLFRTMRTLGDDIHRFCLYPDHKRFQSEWSCVLRAIGGILSEIRERETGISLNELWGLRLRLQSEVLKKCQSPRESLETVADDAVYALCFFYFAIDYHLLPYAIK